MPTKTRILKHNLENITQDIKTKHVGKIKETEKCIQEPGAKERERERG